MQSTMRACKCNSAHISPATHSKPRRGVPVCKATASTELAAAPKLGQAIRHDFPILDQQVHEKPLVYLDNAATSQKPKEVLEALSNYYTKINSNVHRGVHSLAAKATTEFELARERVASLVNAPTDREIVFTRNASESINLVAYAWGLSYLKPGDEIILSVAEHHSNLVPWHLISQRTGAIIKHVKLSATQQLDLEHYESLLSPRTRLVSLVHVSNMLGAVLDTRRVVEGAKKVGALVLLDCCQSLPHMPVDVRTLGADWIVGSGHKMCGPTGVGFLWGRYELLMDMTPFMGGGEMIADVFLDHSTYAAPPSRFEAGTPAIGEAIGLGAACHYLQGLGMSNIHAYEEEVGRYLYERLQKVPKVTIYGPPPSVPGGRAALCSFNVAGVHPTDLSTIMDMSGVAVRSGHHCTQPLHRELGIAASARASLYIYNTAEEVDTFIRVLEESIDFLGA